MCVMVKFRILLKYCWQSLFHHMFLMHMCRFRCVICVDFSMCVSFTSSWYFFLWVCLWVSSSFGFSVISLLRYHYNFCILLFFYVALWLLSTLSKYSFHSSLSILVDILLDSEAFLKFSFTMIVFISFVDVFVICCLFSCGVFIDKMFMIGTYAI